MADEHSHAPSNTNQAELLAINRALKVENQRMAELLRQKQHNHSKGGEHKNAEDKDNNDEHTSETKHTIPNPPKTMTKRTNPFTKEVISFEMPKNFTLPTTLKPYQGIEDPNIYVTKFHTMMFMNKKSDPILCRTFPTFLDGAALIWFSNLPKSFVSNFDELDDQFVNHFAASKIYVHNSDYLSTIKQEPNESLKDYITKFAEATNEIHNLNSEVHLHALKSSLQPGKFQETIVIAKPKTLAEFREKATTHIEIEELRALQKAENPTSNREDERRNKHLTDDCVIAKDVLEKLARQGLLDKYIDSSRQKRNTEELGQQSKTTDNSRDKGKKVDSDINPRRRVINCISGGFAGGGCTNSARKKSYRAMMTMTGSTLSQPVNKDKDKPEILFLPEDYKATDHNLDDPVVITAQDGEPLVKKILMDPGEQHRCAILLNTSKDEAKRQSSPAITQETGRFFR
ncbi:uncharacterized protein LOC130945562 [Arachis stenosperma]|uniref:uncharacterized protein LOC130945562 n=1 Tax=Arachis stenosperma TaxID=217475 RepID=UPI0025ABB1E1|nr:uncharacterized protein LOC130945562 [Arachis stenosperma]